MQQEIRMRTATPTRAGLGLIVAAMAFLVAVVAGLILIDPVYALIAAVGVFLLLLFFMQLEVALMVVLAARTMVDLLYLRRGGTVAFALPGFPKTVNIETMIALFIIGAGIVYILGHRFPIFRVPLGAPSFVFLLAMTATFLTSWIPVLTLQHIGRLVSYFILYVLLWNTIRTSKQRDRWVAFLLFWGGLILAVAAYGIVSGNSFLGGAVKQDYYRVSGPLQPLEFGTFLLIPMVLTTALFLYERGGRRMWIGIFLAVLTAFFVASLSRGPWAGFFAALVVFGLLGYRWLPFAALAAGIIVLVVLPSVASRVTELVATPEETTLARRFEVWEQAYRLWLTSPLLGIGLGVGYVQAGEMQPGNRSQLTHSDYTRMLSDAGIIGILAFLFLLAAQGLQGLAVWRRVHLPLHKTLAMAYLGAWAAFLVARATGNVLTHADYQYQFAVLAALVLALPEIESGENPAAARP